MSKEFFKKYQYKIKSLKELKKIMSSNKKEKFILCHGVFDVVHPGHVRHLVYAKTKADKLIVSITADKHIKKGTYRPHIPEGLRALNLAAFEMVDYVIVDTNSTPIKNIKFIKPHFFAKGFEYSSSGLPKATQEEIKALKSYGGGIIFTPGDVVYSSSKFLYLFTVLKLQNEFSKGITDVYLSGILSVINDRKGLLNLIKSLIFLLYSNPSNDRYCWFTFSLFISISDLISTN